MNTATKALIAAGTLALLATPILAQQRRAGAGPAPECRAEIQQLCGGNRGELRTCLREKYTQLSEGCQAELRARMEARGGQSDRPAGGARRGGQGMMAASAAVSNTVSYGPDERQKIDLYHPEGAAGSAPLVVFIHGGGWSFGNHKTTVQAKPQHFTAAGYVFASTGYRLLPDAPVETQAADIGAALQALRTEARANGFDANSIVLMGHSAGAHLAALVATDPQYAGDAFGAIKGVVLLDGAGYDVAAQVKRSDNELPRIYQAAFGSDPARQRALSPITHVGGPDAPHWLALYVAERAASKAQSEALVAALTKAGARAEAVPVTGTDHGRMNRELGTNAGQAQTKAVDAFLKQVFG